MTPTLQTHADAERTLPLVRAISREMRERTDRLETLEARQAAGERDPILESELSLERRELRACERELARLGYAVDADDPHRIVGGAGSFRIDDTRFYRPLSFRP